MKRTLFFAALLTCGSISSCRYSIDEASDEEAQSTFQELAVTIDPSIWEETTRSGESSTTTVVPDYPIHYYLYDQTNSAFLAEQIVTKGDELVATFSVAKGSYTIYAVTGTESVTSYTAACHDSVFHFNPLTEGKDICLGHTDVTITKYYNEAKSVTIHASHIFAKVSLELSNVPSSVTAISARFPGLHKSITWDGTYTTDTATTVIELAPVQEEASRWTASTYIYPNATSTLNLGLSFAFGSAASECLTAALTNNLEAGVQLRLKSTYTASSASSGGIDFVTWNATDEDFSMDWKSTNGVTGGTSNSGSGSNVNNTNNNTTTPSTSEKYAIGTTYGNTHAIIVDKDTEHLVLMGTLTTKNVNTYSVLSDLTWTKPTKAQWQKILQLLGTNTTAFNTALLAKDSAADKIREGQCYSIDDENDKYYYFDKSSYSSSVESEYTSTIYPVTTINIPAN